MPSVIDDLSTGLSDLGLFDQSELRDFLNSLPEGEQPKDGEQFLQALVNGKRLTTYQARQIGAGQGHTLVLGNYVILDKLGQGGMGEVFKAQHLRMQRVVALKLLSAHVTKNQDALKRFQREVVAAARLVHPNIVTAYDADEAKGSHFLVMEHVAGRDLARLVRETGTLSIPQALRCIIQAARGLEYAHQHGVVHRDVKPSNLLLEAGSGVKVLDLGLARLDSVAGQQDELTWTGDIMGTVDYMAPEQAENTKLADARSDIYSLGMSLWFLLTGRPTYDRDSLASKIVAHRTAPIPSLVEARPEASPELNEIFQKLVAKDPRERYQTMAEAIAELEGHLGILADATRALSDENELTVRLANITKREEETVIFVKPAADSTHRMSGLEPTLQMSHGAQAVAQRPAERNRMPLAIALAFLGGAAMIVLTVFLLLPNRGGNVLIEVTDPDVKLVIDNGKVSIVGSVKQKLSLAAGEHELAVTRGNDELTQKFTVGKKATTLLIEVVDGVLQVKQDGQVLGQVKLAAGVTAPVMPDGKFTLEFTPGSKVEVATLKLDRNGELTLEAYVTTSKEPQGKPGVLLGSPLQFALHFDPQTHRLSLESNHDDGAHRIGPLDIMPGRRMHVAAVRAEGEHRLYLEGILVGKEKIESPLVAAAEPFMIGGDFAGAIEEVRVSVAARYDEGFIPAERFAPDDETLALFHVTDGVGETLEDSSGNQHEGKIVEARWIKSALLPSVGTPKIPDFALAFDGQRSYVETPVIYDGDHALTVEAKVRIDPLNVRLSGIATNLANPSRGIGGVSLYLSQKGQFTFSRHLRGEEPRVAWDIPCRTAKWVHVAGVWNGTELNLFIDGKLGGTMQAALKIPFTEMKYPFFIGAERVRDSGGYLFQGQIDELRISRVARYEQDYVPEGRFEPDADTLALYHFDEGSGEILKDSSGHDQHGKIIGAKWVRADEPFPAEDSEVGLSFDGAGDWVNVPTFKMAENIPITFECWARPRSFGSPQYALRLGANLTLKLMTTPRNGLTSWELLAASEFPNKYYLAKGNWLGGVPSRPSHVAGVYDGESFRIYVDGKRQSQPMWLTGDPTPAELPIKLRPANPQASLVIGACPVKDGPIWSFDGELDEVRISQGVRYEADFTPERRFQPDGDTLALYHCDEATGETLTDSSGNNHHGQIVGAKWVRFDGKQQAPQSLARDLLREIDPAKDGLVHDKADDTWKPGTWKLTPEGLKSGNARHELFRLPVDSLPASYSLIVDFSSVEVDGALLASFGVGDTECYITLNGETKEGQRMAGVGDIDGVGNHQNETTARHAPCNLKEWHTLRIDVSTTGDESEVVLLLDGRQITRYQGKTSRLAIKGFKKSYDGKAPKIGLGSMLGNYLFRRVELRTRAPATLADFPEGAIRDREIAAWVQSRGGRVGTQLMMPERWGVFGPGEQLPQEPFLLRQVLLADVKDITSADLANLAGADRLVGLFVSNTAIDAAAALHIAGLPCLRSLDITGTQVTTSSLVNLRALRNLNHLLISPEQVDDKYEFCIALTGLRNLSLTGQTDVDLAAFSPFGNLRLIQLLDRESVDEKAVASLQQANPLCRVVFGAGDKARSAGVDPVLAGMQQLNAKGVTFGGSPFQFRPNERLTDTLLAGNVAWYVNTAEVPANVVLTDKERELLLRVSGLSFDVFLTRQPRSDELARRLDENNNLTKARLTDCDLTDAGLASLQVLVGLHELDVTKTLVTRAGIDAFRKAVPGCHVVSNFGRFPAGFDSPPENPPAAVSPFDATEAKQHQEAWAKHLGVPVEFTDSLGMKARFVPPGEFEMGTTDEQISELLKGNLNVAPRRDIPSEAPRHRVRITKPLYVGVHEVTVKAFRAFVDATGYETEAETSGGGLWLSAEGEFKQDPRCSWKDPGWKIDDNEPAVCLGARDAAEFCQWLAKQDGRPWRLPTEAEWEYFARAGTTTEFCTGDQLTEMQANVANSRRGTNAVGSYPPNPFGLHDVHGNAWEWCSDWFDAEYYRAAPADNPAGPAQARPIKGKSSQVMRGGGWYLSPITARSAYRGWSPVVVTDHGLRIVCDVAAKPLAPSAR